MDANEGAPREVVLHRLLLRLGGLLPARSLVDARFALARGDAATLIESVTQGLYATRAPLAESDLELLTAVAGSPEAGTALRATQTPPTEPPTVPGQYDEPQHAFSPVAADMVPPEIWIPPIVDLTAEHSALREVAADGTDWAATAAAASMPGTVAVWRTWRDTQQGFGQGNRSRVYLVEVATEADDLATRTADVMYALAAEGEEAPLVEIRAVDGEVTAYFLEARRGAALLWAAEADRRIEIARAFDGVDPETGPYFDPDHLRLDSPEREQVLNYLETAPVLLSSTERMIDIVDPESGETSSLDHRTDGRWTWTDTAAFYLRRHGLAPEPEFLAAIRAHDYTVPEVTAVGRHRAIAELFQPSVDEEPADDGETTPA